MSGVNATVSHRPLSPAAPVLAPAARGQLAGRGVQPAPAPPPRRATVPATGPRTTPSLASRVVSRFTPKPPGNDFMDRLDPRERIVYRSVLANIADASKDDLVKPEILKEREVLGKRLGDWPARMLEAAKEFPAAISQQAAHPGSVEATWGKLTDMAQAYLGEFARDNPKAKGVNPQDPGQQRDIVTAMLNSFIRTGEMDETGLKGLLGSLPHEEQQALLAGSKHFDTPVGTALLGLCGEAHAAFKEGAAALLRPDQDAPDARAKADAVITAATNLGLYKHAAGVTGKKDSFEKSDPESAQLATQLREHVEKLYKEDGAFKDLDVARLHKLRSALKTLDADLDKRIIAEADRRIAESTKACRAAIDDAIGQTTAGELAKFTSALDKAFAAHAELAGARRIKEGDGQGVASDPDRGLAQIIKVARSTLSSEQSANLDAWLSKRAPRSLQHTLAAAGEASRSNPDVAEAAAGARMGGCAHMMTLLSAGAASPATAPLARAATTAEAYAAIQKTFGVDLDTTGANTRCTSAFNDACLAVKEGNTTKALECLDNATGALAARLVTHRLAGYGTPSADMQQALLGRLVDESVRALPLDRRGTLLNTLQSRDIQALKKTLREEADSLDKPGDAHDPATAARMRAAVAYLDHLRSSAALVISGGTHDATPRWKDEEVARADLSKSSKDALQTVYQVAVGA